MPVLAGKTPEDWRKSFYYQYNEFPAPHRVRPHYGVVTDRYKLVRFCGTGDEYWELFDLQKDPRELRSVYDQPEYREQVEKLQKELNRLRSDLKAPETVPPDWFGRSPAGKKKPAKSK